MPCTQIACNGAWLRSNRECLVLRYKGTCFLVNTKSFSVYLIMYAQIHIAPSSFQISCVGHIYSATNITFTFYLCHINIFENR